MSMAWKSKRSSILLSVDAEKAFDRIDWLYLECTLEKMGFHSDLINWVRVLNSDPVSRSALMVTHLNNLNYTEGPDKDRLSPHCYLRLA